MSELLHLPASTSRRTEGDASTDGGARLDIRDLSSLTELAAAARVFSAVWARRDGEQILPPELLRALTHAGNYAAGAFQGRQMVGAIAGFRGDHDGHPLLHSHIMGLLPAWRSRGLGQALKLHQRQWALDRGIDTATWTFDPLVRANAYLNLTKLGAFAATYLTDFYGSMADDVNAGFGSDRLLVTWDLRAAQPPVPPASWDDPTMDGSVLLDQDTDGRPKVAIAEGPTLLCRVPADITLLRRNQPDLASRWRHAVRDTMGRAMADGFVAIAMTRTGWYVLERPTDHSTTISQRNHR